MSQQNDIEQSDTIQGLTAVKTRMEHRQFAKYTWKGNLGPSKVCNLFRGALKNIEKSPSSAGTGNVYFCNDFVQLGILFMPLVYLGACFLEHSSTSQIFECLLCDSH